MENDIRPKDPKRVVQAVRAFLWVNTTDDPEPPDWEAEAAWPDDPPWADLFIRALIGRAPSSATTKHGLRALIAKMVVADGLADVFTPSTDPSLYSYNGMYIYVREEALELQRLLLEADFHHGQLAMLQETNALMYEVLMGIGR